MTMEELFGVNEGPPPIPKVESAPEYLRTLIESADKAIADIVQRRDHYEAMLEYAQAQREVLVRAIDTLSRASVN